MNETSGAPGVAAYLEESNAWDCDRVAALRASVRHAWRVAVGACACALSCALALVLLLPLKRVEPFLIRVDNSTGIVDVVPLYTGRLDASQSVSRYFLAHYISVCERFNLSTAESDYQECGAFHSARRNQMWAALWARTNPQSPLNLHRDGSEVSVEIESVSFIQRANGVEDLAQVRYLKSERAAGGQQQRLSHWIATIEYAYAAPSQDPAIRRWNPVGFKILSLVAEPEVTGQASTEALSAGTDAVAAPSATAGAAGRP